MSLSPRAGHQVLVVGHRGASAEEPENTVASIRRAREIGADLVEVDVRATRDGHLVLLHDETLARTVGVTARLADLDLADLGGALPRLDAVLGLAPLLLDLKEPHVEALAGMLPANGAVTVQSRDVDAVRRLHDLRPDVPVAVLGRPRSDQLPGLATWASGVHVHHLRLDRGFVRRLHDHGLRCLTWTVNHPRLVERALGLGVDGVITDQPGALVGRLGRSGAWCPNGTSSAWPRAASTEGSIAFAVRR